MQNAPLFKTKKISNELILVQPYTAEKKPKIRKSVIVNKPAQTKPQIRQSTILTYAQMQQHKGADQRLYVKKPKQDIYVPESLQFQNFFKDEEIKVQEFVQTPQKYYNLIENITLQLSSVNKYVKLSSTETQVIPAQVSLKSKEAESEDNDNQSRPYVDLICVIDQSESMTGQKLELVKSTLLQLIDLLTPQDRLCLITFEFKAHGLLPLTTLSQANLPQIRQKISGINATGGTDINSGLDLAFKVLSKRNFKNQVSSIFLLSDGIDLKAKQFVPITLAKYQLQNFTIQSFGYGSDHDPELMSGLAKLKDGNFYFVEKLNQVDEMFVDALGGLFSVIAQNVEIKVRVRKNHKYFKDVNVVETYGDFWKFEERLNEYKINIEQFISGVSKDFLLELEIPPIFAKLMDNERNTVLLEAEVTYQSLGEKETIKKIAELELTFYNENDQVPVEINENVEMNVLRVRGAKAMKNAQTEADKGNYEKGQKFISEFQVQIQNAKPETQAKLGNLMSDLEQNKQSCSRNNYESYGKKQLICSNKAHMEQRSQAIHMDGDMYMNSVQKKMVSITKLKKK